MLARIFRRHLLGAPENFLGFCANRCFGNEYSPYIPGGGLEKLQGGFKEESYFKLNDLKLMLKMREQTLRGSGYDTTDINVAIAQVNQLERDTEMEAHRQQGLMNKQKNCMEELFFLAEETMNLRRLETKMRAQLEQKLRDELAAKKRQRADAELANGMESLPQMPNAPMFS
ncbi:PREDICTED: uncharacterized protein LOC108376947 [Rhagoletis zephyria]|uniref:uncharacterized protein LOC108376947 n=1 Tax=Rhagoletis zephyria TaxID=28612 RepID=UPI0008113BA9|nr:PREDICTED: uncharacterized protein LOC108376947 [Rhagoletis zephyria]